MVHDNILLRVGQAGSLAIQSKDGRLRSVPAPTPIPDQHLDSDSDSSWQKMELAPGLTLTPESESPNFDSISKSEPLNPVFKLANTSNTSLVILNKMAG